MCEKHGTDGFLEEDLQEAADILEAQRDIPRPDLDAFNTCLDTEVNRIMDRFDSRYDLSDDPMDQAKMAKLRREELDINEDLYR